MNKVVLIGYLGQDPDFREFEPRDNNSGSSLVKISVAVYDARNSRETYFIPCVAWNNTAIYISKNLQKGSFVSIDGRLIRRSYINKDGNKIYIMEVVIDQIKNYGKSERRTSENSYQAYDSNKTPQYVNNNNNSTQTEAKDDTLTSKLDWENDLE